MIVIDHRRNTRKLLEATAPECGVEIDLRSGRDGLLYLHHDPCSPGEAFSDWLCGFRHRFLIANVKEEGLEQRVLTLLAQHGIEDFFFLDQSFPFLLRTAQGGERRAAVRISEYESVDTALSLAGLVDWIWVDCFERNPLTRELGDRLQGAGFRLCLVSPELQGRSAPGTIAALQGELAEAGIVADAVCTKRPERWLGR